MEPLVSTTADTFDYREFVTRNIVAGVTNVTIKELGRQPLSDVPEGQG